MGLGGLVHSGYRVSLLRGLNSGSGSSVAPGFFGLLLGLSLELVGSRS